MPRPCPVAAANTSGLVGDHCTWKMYESETLTDIRGLTCNMEWTWTIPSVPALTNKFLQKKSRQVIRWFHSLSIIGDEQTCDLWKGEQWTEWTGPL